jgi:hypothetical protein
VERDARKLAAMIIESLLSEARAFAFSRSLVDEKVVDELVKGSGAAGMLVKWSQGDIVVYYIRSEALERECAYSECSREPPESKGMCVRRCLERALAKAAQSIAKSIAEYASYAARG